MKILNLTSRDKIAVTSLIVTILAAGLFLYINTPIEDNPVKFFLRTGYFRENIPVDKFLHRVSVAYTVESAEPRARLLVKALEIKGRGNMFESHARIRLADAYIDLGDTESATRQLELCKALLAQVPTTGSPGYDQIVNSQMKQYGRDIDHIDKGVVKIWIYKVEKRLGRQPRAYKDPKDIFGFLFNRAIEIQTPDIRKRELLFLLANENIPDHIEVWVRVHLADTYLDIGDTENAHLQFKQYKFLRSRSQKIQDRSRFDDLALNVEQALHNQR